MATKCMYCDSTKYGPGCTKSTNGLHQHNTDENHCMYCGKTAYGDGCLQTPTRKHVHGPGGLKCKWCGSTKIGSMGCEHSPNRKHET